MGMSPKAIYQKMSHCTLCQANYTSLTQEQKVIIPLLYRRKLFEILLDSFTKQKATCPPNIPRAIATINSQLDELYASCSAETKNKCKEIISHALHHPVRQSR